MRLTASDALIVVDVQNDFTRGTMAVPGAAEIIAPINRVAAAIAHVIVVTDWHPPGHVSFASAHGVRHGDAVETAIGTQKVFNDHCVQGEWGAELDPDLALTKAELVFRKGYRADLDSFSAFYWNDETTSTGLSAYLKARGIERLFCAGLARFGCVMKSALGAARDGFTVAMIDDASKGRPNPVEDERSLERLAEAGVTWTSSLDLLGRGTKAA